MSGHNKWSKVKNIKAKNMPNIFNKNPTKFVEFAVTLSAKKQVKIGECLF